MRVTKWRQAKIRRKLALGASVDTLRVLHIFLKAKPTTEAPARPPVNAEFLLHLLLRKDEQEGAVGDFLQRYAKKLESLGERRASLWAYRDVLETVWPVLIRALKKIGGISALLAAAEWLRHSH